LYFVLVKHSRAIRRFQQVSLAMDPRHPNVVVPVLGPIAAFALGRPASPLSRSALLTAAQNAKGSSTWRAETGKEPLLFKPFAAIEGEQNRLYHDVEP
jgi:hypothetical protein